MVEVWQNIIDSAWVHNTFLVVYAATVILILGIVLAENRNPVKSLAWITVLLLLPIVGIILYIFFGRNIRNTRMISRRNRRRLKRAERYRNPDLSALGLREQTQQQIKLARSLCDAQYFPGNDIRVFTSGQAKMAALEADLRAATRYINLQYYIFTDDNAGRRIAKILMDKAREGVKVRVIYDHVGSFRTKNRFWREMRKAGVECHPFFKVTLPVFGSRINWRNHRKLVVIDGAIGYVGGMNIADRYIDGGKNFKSWRDAHLRLTGPAVRSLQYSFAVDWNFMGMPLIEDEVPETPENGEAGAQMVTSGPTSSWSNDELIYQRAIASAQKRIFIQTPYFLPTDGLLKALQTAALARVDVRIILPQRSDSRMLDYASFSYIAECLRSGIKIYLYEPGMMHAKTMIIDDEVSAVGSTNFDFRSFEHNFEGNMFVYSRQFNERMTSIFMGDLRHSRRLLPTQWARRSYVHKAAESIVRLLSPIL
ncbi:MAG: cardiolipin synthase [Muribaculaceae bacterium]